LGQGSVTLHKPTPDGAGSENGQDNSGQAAHFRALESLYAAAPINQLFPSKLRITGPGQSEIQFEIDPKVYHAAGAAHGTSYFKMLDDAAFYAANSMVNDRFLLTTAFNMLFTRPVKAGQVTAIGQWVSGRRRVYVADSRLINSDGEEIARGTGTFMLSRFPLSSLPGYAKPAQPGLTNSA
jgi:uncharacterized protein (TIGR00369 family)